MLLVCSYNLYTDTAPGSFPNYTVTAAEIIAGWTDCEAELDARKKNR
jgi:hypothetical protein